MQDIYIYVYIQIILIYACICLIHFKSSCFLICIETVYLGNLIIFMGQWVYVGSFIFDWLRSNPPETNAR